MNIDTRKNFDDLRSSDGEIQHQAFMGLLEETDHPVSWAYEVWDELIYNLGHQNNRQRAIAAQILCKLAKSDPENRMLNDLPLLIAVTKDERFVTARHTLQALWKVGVVGDHQRDLLVKGLQARFKECVSEKNGTLIRYDILQSLKNLYDEVNDVQILETALELIESEEDLKYRKKYTTLWKPKRTSRSQAVPSG